MNKSLTFWQNVFQQHTWLYYGVFVATDQGIIERQQQHISIINLLRV